MTPEQKMLKVVEAARECWHEFVAKSVHQKENDPKIYLKCPKCKASVTMDQVVNPSPTDLNELFRLADKLGNRFIYFNTGLAGQRNVEIPGKTIGVIQACESSPAEALLNALYEAVSFGTA
jgi:hypothetical protein